MFQRCLYIKSKIRILKFFTHTCIHVLLFQEMGFSQEQAESAIKRFGSVQQALDSLLAGVGKDLRLRSHGNNKSIKGTRVRVTNTNTPCYCFTIVFLLLLIVW